MIIDGNLIFSENQAITAASVNSDKVVSIGSGVAYEALFVNVNLTTPFTSGRIDKIKLQTATDAAFTTPVDLMEVSVLAGIDETKPQNLAMFRLPFNTLPYLRLVYTASGTPAGGQVFASLVKDVPVR